MIKKIIKANVKKHVIIASLSAVCVAMVCVIAAQFNTKLPTAEIKSEETTEAKIIVEITTNAKEKNKPAVPDKSAVDKENAVETAETSDIQHEDFIKNGGVEVDQSFEAATKPEAAPPPPEITDDAVLTNPAEPPEYESEQIEIKPQATEPPSDTPKHGYKKDGMIYINGFGWIPDEGGGSKSEYAGGMYENGNKIGNFG